MTVAGHRPERIAEEIRNEVGLMLEGELKDPRLAGGVTVSAVRVSPDLKLVRIYVRVIGEALEREKAFEGLTTAAGFVRHELTERLQLRRAPEVHFFLDDSDQYARRIEALLRETKGPEST